MTRSKQSKPTSDHFIQQVLSDPRYRGKHLVVIANKVFAARSAREASRLFDRVIREFPKDQPLLTYIPKADTLILWRE